MATLTNFRPLFLVAAAIMAFAAVSACGGEEVVEETTGDDVEWGYSGAGAPENWASISTDYSMCSEGTKQSPVDITGYQKGDAPPLSFSFRRDAVEVVNDGKALSINYTKGNRLGLSERTYQLTSVRTHTPSEHTIDGQSFALELQLFHEQTFGDLAIVSFLYTLGDPDPVIQNIIDAAPDESGQSITEGLVLNAADYAPEDLGYYKYEGSLTTPPCTEPVDWFIMLEQGSVSQEQIDQVAALTGGGNNRPLQPLGDRSIAISGSRK